VVLEKTLESPLDGKLNLNGLAPDAFQGVGQELGVAVNWNAYTEN